MHIRTILLTAMMASVALSGCTAFGGGGPTGSMNLHIADESPFEVDIDLRAWANNSQGWVPFLSEAHYAFNGSADERSVEGSITAGGYQAVRLLFDEVKVDNQTALLAQTGIEFPVLFDMSDGGDLDFHIGFNWEHALYQTSGGVAFEPILTHLTVMDGTTQLLHLEADEIKTGSAFDPVARIRAFDSTGIEVFKSDFVAGDSADPFVANPGNFTFVGSLSEAIGEDNALDRFEWIIDGEAHEGITVNTAIDVKGNTSVQLKVTDSNGLSDTQSIVLAIKPAAPKIAAFPVSGSVAHPGTNYAPVANTGLAACDAAGAEDTADIPVDIDFTNLGEDGDDATGGVYRIQVGVTMGGPLQAAWPSIAKVQLYDPGGASMARSGAGGSPATGTNFDVSSPESQPVSGTYTVQIQLCTGAGSTFDGQLEVQYTTDPQYDVWISNYDDGHTHQH